jgi:hypothetical protein
MSWHFPQREGYRQECGAKHFPYLRLDTATGVTSDKDGTARLASSVWLGSWIGIGIFPANEAGFRLYGNELPTLHVCMRQVVEVHSESALYCFGRPNGLNSTGSGLFSSGARLYFPSTSVNYVQIR